MPETVPVVTPSGSNRYEVTLWFEVDGSPVGVLAETIAYPIAPGATLQQKAQEAVDRWSAATLTSVEAHGYYTATSDVTPTP